MKSLRVLLCFLRDYHIHSYCCVQSYKFNYLLAAIHACPSKINAFCHPSFFKYEIVKLALIQNFSFRVLCFPKHHSPSLCLSSRVFFQGILPGPSQASPTSSSSTKLSYSSSQTSSISITHRKSDLHEMMLCSVS